MGHWVKRTVEIGAVALWYQFMLEKISCHVNIAKALFSINLVKNPHILSCFFTFWRHNLINFSWILMNLEPIISPVQMNLQFDLVNLIMVLLRVSVHVWFDVCKLASHGAVTLCSDVFLRILFLLGKTRVRSSLPSVRILFVGKFLFTYIVHLLNHGELLSLTSQLCITNQFCWTRLQKWTTFHNNLVKSGLKWAIFSPFKKQNSVKLVN